MAKYFWRKYRCDECGHVWDRLSEPKDPLDECPQCSLQQQQAEAYVNKAPLVGGKHVNSIKNQAIESTMRMMQEDYGIPGHLINDNMRQGDVAVKGDGKPPADYVAQQKSANIKDFLAAGAAAGKLGPKENMTGNDIIEAGRNTAHIPDPRHHLIAMGTDKKEYIKT